MGIAFAKARLLSSLRVYFLIDERVVRSTCVVAENALVVFWLVFFFICDLLRWGERLELTWLSSAFQSLLIFFDFLCRG